MTSKTFKLLHDGKILVRHVSFSNSSKRAADRYKDDREQALEYTTSFSTLRKGGVHNIPDLYDDNFIPYKKYETKPKRNNHKNQKSIRKMKIDN